MTSADIVGQWSGVLNIQGTQLPLVFHIMTSGQGLSSTMDSPEQHQYDLVVDSTSYKAGTLLFMVKNLRLEYSGQLNAKGDFEGTFTQNGYTFPLTLSRGMVKKNMDLRPQEPKAPYPYQIDSVTFENKKAGVALSGTFTRPKPEGKYPVVILISGSGPSDRDEMVFGHKPFLVLADYLTRQGLAVLRYDDRGVGHSTGDYTQTTTLDFAADVESALNYLATRDDVDTKHMGLIGHSEGGVIADVVASRNRSVAFIVRLAGPTLRGDKLLMLQTRVLSLAMGATDEQLAQSQTINRGVYDLLLDETLPPLKRPYVLEDYLKKAYQELGTDMTDKDLKDAVAQLITPWFVSYVRLDPMDYFKKVKCPILALDGSKDLQVPAKENLGLINDFVAKASTSAPKTNIKTVELPNLNHLFQPCDKGLPSEYSTIKTTMSPDVLALIWAWIQPLTL